MRDLDFVPMPRGRAAASVPFAPRADVAQAATALTQAPRTGTSAPRAVALARLDAPAAPDPAARAAGWTAGYAAGARAAAAEAAEQQRVLAERAERAEEQRAAEHAAALAALARAADELRARRAPVLAEALDLTRASALELAVALLGVELSDASASARAAMARALSADDLPDDVTVHLSPRDAATVDAAGLRVVADPALAPGDAVVEHTDGYLDARLTAAVERARTALGVS